MASQAPLQPELPFDLGIDQTTTPLAPPSPASSQDDSILKPAAWQPVTEEPGPALSRQLLDRLRGLPWARWGELGQRALKRGGNSGATGGSRLIRLATAAAGTAVAHGAPYAATLARKTARTGLVRAGLRLGALAVHAGGFPAVVTRTAIQFSVIHRAGLRIESVTYFEVADPAGYVVYQAPTKLSAALSIAFVPALILAALAVLCLAPTITPRAILHQHAGLLTWLEVWLGLGFAAHALPTHEEAEPLADQARAGVGQAEPLALVAIVPALLVAWVTRFGGLPPAVIGILAGLWASGLVFR
jgi:hypothetical protein